MNTPDISAAKTEADLAAIRSLFQDYGAEWPGQDLADEDFAEEARSLPGLYAPPNGRLLLAKFGRDAAGCIALRRLSARIAEVKRLYVPPQFRTLKIGRGLVAAVIAEAKGVGYRTLRLDTTNAMHAATGLYRSLGFQPIGSYAGKSTDGNIFMELKISGALALARV